MERSDHTEEKGCPCQGDKKVPISSGENRHKVPNEVETFCEALADAARVRVRICRNGFRRENHASKLRVSRSRNKEFGVHILSKKMKGRQARKTGKITDSLTLCSGREWTAGPKAMSFVFQISQRQAGRECMVHAAMVVSVQLNMLEALIQWVAQRNDLELAMVAKSFDGASSQIARPRSRNCKTRSTPWPRKFHRSTAIFHSGDRSRRGSSSSGLMGS